MSDETELTPCTPPPCPPWKDATLSAVAVGGWCAPSEVPLPSAFSTDGLEFNLPDFQATRGGLSFDPPTPAEAAAAEAVRAQVLRDVERMTRWRAEVMDDACAVALANGWDVHVYYHPDYGWTRADLDSARVTGRIGIQFRPAKYAIPTVVEHRDVDATWDDDEDWSEAP